MALGAPSLGRSPLAPASAEVLIADQVIRRMEFLHSVGLIHRVAWPRGHAEPRGKLHDEFVQWNHKPITHPLHTHIYIDGFMIYVV